MRVDTAFSSYFFDEFTQDWYTSMAGMPHPFSSNLSFPVKNMLGFSALPELIPFPLQVAIGTPSTDNFPRDHPGPKWQNAPLPRPKHQFTPVTSHLISFAIGSETCRSIYSSSLGYLRKIALASVSRHEKHRHNHCAVATCASSRRRFNGLHIAHKSPVYVRQCPALGEHSV